jgi:hypothetical protein
MDSYEVSIGINCYCQEDSHLGKQSHIQQYFNQDVQVNSNWCHRYCNKCCYHNQCNHLSSY